MKRFLRRKPTSERGQFSTSEAPPTDTFASPLAHVEATQFPPPEASPSNASLKNNSVTVDTIDKADPYGIKVLHNPPSAVVDIVFVHGLTGNAYTTWLHGRSIHGPRDLFSEDLANARIMTFGYDADVVKFWHHAAQD